MRGAAISSVPSASVAASKASSPGTANALPAPWDAGRVSTSSVEPGRRHRHAGPLAAAHRLPEEPVTQHGQDHDAGREHGLHGGERHERERRDVQQPGAGADRHAEREPARGEQRARALSGSLEPDLRRGCGAAVLAQKAQLRGHGAHERQPDPQFQVLLPLVRGPRTQDCRERAARASAQPPTLPVRDWGNPQRNPDPATRRDRRSGSARECGSPEAGILAPDDDRRELRAGGGAARLRPA